MEAEGKCLRGTSARCDRSCHLDVKVRSKLVLPVSMLLLPSSSAANDFGHPIWVWAVERHD